MWPAPSRPTARSPSICRASPSPAQPARPCRILLPCSLPTAIFAAFMRGFWKPTLGDSYEAAHARMVVECLATAHARLGLLAKGQLKPLADPASQAAANDLYLDATRKLAAGLSRVLAAYEQSTDPRKLQLAGIWKETAQNHGRRDSSPVQRGARCSWPTSIQLVLQPQRGQMCIAVPENFDPHCPPGLAKRSRQLPIPRVSVHERFILGTP